MIRNVKGESPKATSFLHKDISALHRILGGVMTIADSAMPRSTRGMAKAYS
jgi:hypothetical protein